MNKKKIVILYGGRSVEHGVSVNSARNIFEYIDREKFEPVPIGISPEGRWFLTDGVTREMSAGKPISIPADPAKSGFVSEDIFIQPDLVFPVLHGTDGEDGSIQGLLKAIGIPFVGSGVLGSALSMNKVVAKQLLAAAGLPVAPFRHFHFSQKAEIHFDQLVSEFGLPMMVKSASLGSSVGVSKVKNQAEFNKALEDSFSYDDEVIIEQYISGREIECALLGNNPPEASMPGEIILSPEYGFYSFDAKYVDGDAVSIKVPADLDAGTAQAVRELSVRAFTALRCEDFARVDLFLSASGIFINEINTIPGFTNASMFPMMWKERGLSFTDLITRLIELAFRRNAQAGRTRQDFQSGLNY